MSKFDEVTQKLQEVPFMTADRAEVLRSLMQEVNAEQVLEIGFYQGKSTAYIAAILEDMGRGNVTTIDLTWAKSHKPGITENLAAVNLSNRVMPIFARRSYTWEMGRMLKIPERPQFDFCYFDGGHTWDLTGFGFLLVDMLLRPGGIIVVDDLNWSISRSIQNNPEAAKHYERYDRDEVEERSVRLVWNTIVPRLGYHRTLLKEWPWGIARKPTTPK